MRTQDTGGAARRQRLKWGRHTDQANALEIPFLKSIIVLPSYVGYSYYSVCIYYHLVHYYLVIITERCGYVRGIVDSWTHHISSC